jgi:hypothetical protein
MLLNIMEIYTFKRRRPPSFFQSPSSASLASERTSFWASRTSSKRNVKQIGTLRPIALSKACTGSTSSVGTRDGIRRRRKKPQRSIIAVALAVPVVPGGPMVILALSKLLGVPGV